MFHVKLTYVGLVFDDDHQHKKKLLRCSLHFLNIHFRPYIISSSLSVYCFSLCFEVVLLFIHPIITILHHYYLYLCASIPLLKRRRKV